MKDDGVLVTLQHKYVVMFHKGVDVRGLAADERGSLYTGSSRRVARWDDLDPRYAGTLEGETIWKLPSMVLGAAPLWEVMLFPVEYGVSFLQLGAIAFAPCFNWGPLETRFLQPLTAFAILDLNAILSRFDLVVAFHSGAILLTVGFTAAVCVQKFRGDMRGGLSKSR